MSKVYRYLLRNEEDELVTLATELKFVDSYYYLLKTRYGDGLRITVDMGRDEGNKWLPPLTLQTIIENAFTQNVIAREQPLHIHLERTGDSIIVRNTVQPKWRTQDRDIESGIDNLVTRYFLLHQSKIVINDNDKERVIQLPLFDRKEEEEK
jgi:two-component system LytT family sensor kinase